MVSTRLQEEKVAEGFPALCHLSPHRQHARFSGPVHRAVELDPVVPEHVVHAGYCCWVSLWSRVLADV